MTRPYLRRQAHTANDGSRAARCGRRVDYPRGNNPHGERLTCGPQLSKYGLMGGLLASLIVILICRARKGIDYGAMVGLPMRVSMGEITNTSPSPLPETDPAPLLS